MFETEITHTHMKIVVQSMLGVNANQSRPSTVEEFNANCPAGESILSYACDEAYYRCIAPKIRAKYLDAVETETGVKPRVISTRPNTKEGGEPTNIYEKDTVYIKNVLASKMPDDSPVTKEILQPLLQKAFDEVGWDLTTTRQSGPTKKDRDMVEAIIAKIEDGSTNYTTVKTNFEKRNPGLTIELEEDNTITEDNLAEACRVDRIRREQDSVI